MGFDYNSRQKLAKDYFENWKKENKAKISKVDKKLFEEAVSLGPSYSAYDKLFTGLVKEKYAKKKYAKPSEFMRENLGDLVDIFVPRTYIQDYYDIVDEFLTFQYTTGYSRRSFRTKDFSCHIYHAIRLMYSYMSFGMYGVTVTDYIRDNMPAEMLDYKRNCEEYYGVVAIHCADDIIAARINAMDTGVIEAIKEAILSENNTVIVTRAIIKAIMKSKNEELHDLLGKFLVAARLSEGVRQVICECADEGRIDSFVTLLKVIDCEKLTRFAAVKRAFAVWTGFIDESNIDRLIAKIMPVMLSTINDLEAAKELLKTDDSIYIIIGLWALAANDVAYAMNEMEQIATSGTKIQKLTMSYFNRMLQNSSFSGRIARYVVENNEDDFELIGAFLPTYLNDASTVARHSYEIKSGNEYDMNQDSDYEYHRITLEDVFDVKIEELRARKHYEILMKNLSKLEKKKIEISPFIFPWYSMKISRGDFVMRMAIIAYALQDECYIDETCQMLTDIDGQYSDRKYFVRMLLHNPTNELQRKMLLRFIADKETYTRGTAYMILKKMDLRQDEYETLAGFLKYKTEEIRKYVINILKKQSKENLIETVKLLLNDKNENKRLAGFDILKTEFQEEKAVAKIILEEADVEDTLTEQEKVLWNEICGMEEKASEEIGYGIYNPDATLAIPDTKGKINRKLLKDYFSIPRKELDRIFIELNDYMNAHGNLEYRSAGGDTRLLCNGLYLLSYDRNLSFCDSYPFKELWREFYEEHIHSEKLIMNMKMALYAGYDENKVEDYDGYLSFERELLYNVSSDYQLPELNKNEGERIPARDLSTAVNIMADIVGASIPREVAIAACEYMAEIPEEKRWLIEPEIKRTNSYMRLREREYRPFTHSSNVYTFIINLMNEKIDTDYADIFFALRRLDIAYKYQEREVVKYYNRASQRNILNVYPFICACINGIITKDYLYKYIFEELPFEVAVDNLGVFSGAALTYSEYMMLSKYVRVDMDTKTVDKDNDFWRLGKELYDAVSNLILDVELKRGDTETKFSSASKRLKRVYGIDRLGQILTALGKDTLDRSTYYFYSSGNGKRECLSHLLQIAYPLEGESASDLKAIKVSEDRLIEVAMYAPQWIDLIEAYLKCEGLKSGCYYFMAHMNERFDDKKKAIIAKYTPLDAEELNNGAFDLNWFFESYNKLGEKMFQKLYKAAKYISDGNKHARARKYADAALGNVDRDALELTIADKRNKDLLMSYGIIPVKDEMDKLHRYEFIQKFLKESRQFGAQRRASEKLACEMALKNLATTAGYADSLRLILAMETALISENQKYFDGFEIDNYFIKAVISEGGKADISVEKDLKKLKSVPAALKKNEIVNEIKEFVSKLKDQYSRTVKMFENSMEEREEYAVGELQELCKNPVIKAILTKLIFVSNNEFYIIDENGDFAKAISDTGKVTLKSADLMRVAHPYDMYMGGCWSELQELVFNWANDSKKYQPFKQVFRELYVKLTEEMEQTTSRMFAGNQIQPKKTVATLKNRRWIADYEDGLQKIYYKDNIIATIYALADWFSPSDVEEPTLEYVKFYDRKTLKEKKLSEIPDIIYSEVMRDVDLAVSVAHAGGVDPETSHVTIELRKSIIAFNLKLFKLTNVRLEGTHGYITGTYGEYSVHLGSGMIHKMPGIAVNVLPVHSQNRGKIFLPFIDEDPKTAEIMSKIIMLAQDNKIKDPQILESIIC